MTRAQMIDEAVEIALGGPFTAWTRLRYRDFCLHNHHVRTIRYIFQLIQQREELKNAVRQLTG